MGNILRSRSSINDLNTVTLSPESTHPSLVIRRKLLANAAYKSKLSQDPTHLTQISEILSDAEKLKETYLSTEWVRTEEIWREARGVWQEQRDEMRQKIEMMRDERRRERDETRIIAEDTLEEREALERGKENTANDAHVENGMEASSSLQEHDPDFTPTDDPDAEDATVERYMQQFKLTQLPKVVSVKLIISEAIPSTSRQTLREIMSPVLSTLHVQPEYGLYHCGLCVAAWILEWNNSGLCIPRKVVSSAALMSIDIDRWSNTDLQSAVDKMAEVIVRWNTTMKYTNGVGRRSGNMKKNEGNCQDFVDDMLQALNIRVDFQGALKEFLNDLRTKGRSELKFKISSLFRETFDLDENVSEIIFKTHAQLDEFVHKIKSHKASFKLDLDFNDERFLLKSYDRAFWMKNFKYEDDERWKPSPKCNCPFKDPRDTKSVLLFGQ